MEAMEDDGTGDTLNAHLNTYMFSLGLSLSRRSTFVLVLVSVCAHNDDYDDYTRLI